MEGNFAKEGILAFTVEVDIADGGQLLPRRATSKQPRTVSSLTKAISAEDGDLREEGDYAKDGNLAVDSNFAKESNLPRRRLCHKRQLCRGQHICRHRGRQLCQRLATLPTKGAVAKDGIVMEEVNLRQGWQLH